MTRRAILLVPGFSKQSKNKARDVLVEAIGHYSPGIETRSSEADVAQGNDFVTVTMQNMQVPADHAEASPREIDIYEAHWTDVLPDWNDETPFRRFWRALKVVIYWFLGSLPALLFKRRLRFAGWTNAALVGAGMILLIWLALAGAALYQDLGFVFEEFTPAASGEGGGAGADVQSDAGNDTDAGEVNGEATGMEALVGWFAATRPGKLLGAFFTLVVEHPFVSLVIMFFGMGGIERIANVASVLRAYLIDLPTKGEEMGIRAKMRKSVTDVLGQIFAKADEKHADSPLYDEVFVVGHSMGGAICVDALADYGRDLERMTLFTWGSPLGVLSVQDAKVLETIARLYDADYRPANWIDIAFRRDLYGTPAPMPPLFDAETGRETERPALYPETVRPTRPWGQLLRASQTHEDYYRCKEAILMLLKPSSALPPRLDGKSDAQQPSGNMFAAARRRALKR
jgi:pimeloyl-ACP methyl ester carboxylesterase